MTLAEEPFADRPEDADERVEDQRLALRRISQKLKQLQAEFDSLHRPQAGGR